MDLFQPASRGELSSSLPASYKPPTRSFDGLGSVDSEQNPTIANQKFEAEKNETIKMNEKPPQKRSTFYTDKKDLKKMDLKSNSEPTFSSIDALAAIRNKDNDNIPEEEEIREHRGEETAQKIARDQQGEEKENKKNKPKGKLKAKDSVAEGGSSSSLKVKNKDPKEKEAINKKKSEDSLVKKWNEFLISTPLSRNGLQWTSKELTQLIFKGIPAYYRPTLWLHFALHSESQRINTENINNEQKEKEIDGSIRKGFQQYLKQGEGVSILKTIEADLERTFPEHPDFTPQSINIVNLRAVLLAYSQRNPVVGYCQGMNFIVGMFLLAGLNPESSFEILSIYIEKLIPDDYYSSQLLGVNIDQEVINK